MLSVEFYAGFEGIIDLNGHTISAANTPGYCSFRLYEGAKLTIEDSSTAKTGKLKNISFNVKHENSVLTVNAGEFTLDYYDEIVYEYSPLFYVNEGSLNVNSGTFTCYGDVFCVKEGNVKIEDGTFTSEDDIVIEATGGDITINNGTFIAKYDDCLDFEEEDSKLNVVINNGKFYSDYWCPIDIDGGNLTINNGIFEGEDQFEVDNDDNYFRDTTVTINDGTFKSYESSAIYFDNYIDPGENVVKLVINGGTFIGFDSALNVFCTKYITLNGGTFKATIDSERLNHGAVCIYVENEEDKEEARSILAEGYRFYNNNELTLREYYGEKYYCTDKEVKVAPEKFNVKVETATNGRLGVDKTLVAPGEEVKIVAEANEGYEVDKITVKTASGEVVEVSNNAFVMPIDDVVVSATFKTVETPEEPKEPDEKDDTPKTGCAMPNMLVALFAVLFK